LLLVEARIAAALPVDAARERIAAISARAEGLAGPASAKVVSTLASLAIRSL
jgi:hypothetical protein